AARGDGYFVVHLFEGAGDEEVAAAMDAVGRVAGTTILKRERVAGVESVTIAAPIARAAEIAAVPAVQFIEDAPEFTERNSTVRGVVQSNTPGVEPLYANGLHGEGQIIGMLDSRINVSHCSFADTNPIGPTHRKILAYHASAGSAQHGTHTSCTAVGDAGDFSDTRGLAYLAKLVYSLIPTLTEASVTASLNTHHADGARVHSNSWGNDATTSYDGVCRAIDAFCRANEDDLVVFAVSNGSLIRNPENAKNCLAVAASQDNPTQDSWCIGGTGPTSDGRRKPEIMAPGCDTFSAWNLTACDTISLFGTSYATPAISGTALLVRQYYMDGFHPTGAPNVGDGFTPTGALLKATLLNSAADMTGVAGYPSNQEGWGRLWIDQTLYFPGDARHMLAVSDIRNANGLSTGQQDEEVVAVGAGQVLRVTLVWTEPPASIGASFAAVNDLDLQVIAPGTGGTFKGNVFSGGVSVVGGVKDDRNNVEQVLLAAPLPGTYTVRVSAPAVNVGPQGYALVVTGATYCAGDLNGDRSVGLGDIAIIIQNWNTAGPAGDANGDGVVGLADVAMLIMNWSTTCPQ
ncbi:MAG TPA: S8 family serine peptidase, partial [Phycisphaerales bacterium]|nr:S8 family serine peptidase [Phycisphaerales bacterium]